MQCSMASAIGAAMLCNQEHNCRNDIGVLFALCNLSVTATYLHFSGPNE